MKAEQAPLPLSPTPRNEVRWGRMSTGFILADVRSSTPKRTGCPRQGSRNIGAKPGKSIPSSARLACDDRLAGPVGPKGYEDSS